MFSTPVEVPAAARARWLAEVAEMLKQAELLVNRLKVGGQHAGVIGELELRIRVAKGEVEALRANRSTRSELDPNGLVFRHGSKLSEARPRGPAPDPCREPAR